MIFNHQFSATTPSILTPTTPASFFCIEYIYKFDRYTRQTLGLHNQHTELTYTCRFK